MRGQILIGVVLGLLLAYLYHAFLVPSGAPAFPIIVKYDPQNGLQVGVAHDRSGVPFNWTNPGR